MVRARVCGPKVLRLVLLAALLALSGCGTGTGGEDPTVTDGRSSSDENLSSKPDPGGGKTVISAEPEPGGGQSSGAPELSGLPWAPLDSDSDPADLAGVPWTLLGTIEQGRVLAITYSLDMCARPDHVEVSESDSKVSIAVWALKPAPDQPCAATSQVVQQLVQLAGPLDDRELVDPARAAD
jgi:hypothetical protein